MPNGPYGARKLRHRRGIETRCQNTRYLLRRGQSRLLITKNEQPCSTNHVATKTRRAAAKIACRRHRQLRRCLWDEGLQRNTSPGSVSISCSTAPHVRKKGAIRATSLPGTDEPLCPSAARAHQAFCAYICCILTKREVMARRNIKRRAVARSPS